VSSLGKFFSEQLLVEVEASFQQDVSEFRQKIKMEIISFRASKEIYGPEVDLFNLPPTDISVVASNYQKISATTTVRENNNPINFRISQSSTSFLDLRDSFIHVKARILKSDGSNLLDTDKIAPCNLFLHTLFQNVNVKFNERLVSTSNNMYAYQAWIRNLISTSSGTKDSEMSKEMYYKDSDPDDFTDQNLGFKKRRQLAAGSKPFELIGRISDGIFDQTRYIPNTVNVDVEFTRNNPKFCLSGLSIPKRTAREAGNTPVSGNGSEDVTNPPAADQPAAVGSNDENQADQPTDNIPSTVENEYRVEIDDMSIYIKRRSLEAGLFNTIQKKFSQGKLAMYPVTRTVMNTAVIQAGTMQYINSSLSTGMLPQLICLGIVSSRAYHGKLDKSPFNFKHNNISRLVLTINGQPALYNALDCNFENKEYLLAYNTLFGRMTSKCGNGINMEDYVRGNTLYVLDLGRAVSKPLLGETEGTIGLEIRFSNPLEEHQNLIMMTQSQSLIEIDRFGSVQTVL
jgi:hypothetical protein